MTIEKSLDEITKTLEANEKTVMVPPSLQVEDQMELAGKYLTDLAKEGLNRKSTTMLSGKDGEITSRCIFFGAVVATDKIELGVEKMAEIANDLANKGYLHSALAPIISIKLAILPGQVETVAVVFYPLVPIEKVDEIEKAYEFSMKEGDMPKKLGSTDLELPPGEFYAEVRLTHYLIEKEFDSNARLFEAITRYLAILPPGTKFLGAKERAITDLSIPYELRFSNPLLPNVKSVALDWLRNATVIDGKLKEFNLFLGIRYYGSGRELLFQHANSLTTR